MLRRISRCRISRACRCGWAISWAGKRSCCTIEARAFRDRYEQFSAKDAEVVGVSSDSVRSHRRFARRHNLPFLLLSDRDGAVRRLYGVEKTLGLLPGRVTYVIDQTGVV